MQEEIPYWMALAHLPEWTIQRKNEIIVRCFEAKKTIIDLFQADADSLASEYGLKSEELEAFSVARTEVANYAFTAEDLLNQGYQLLPITAENYPKAIKKHLKKPGSPPLLYAKGNLGLLEGPAIAIAAVPKPNEHSLQFTANLVQSASESGKVLACSTVKGVDAKALETALAIGAEVILVIPQGLLTFSSGFRKLYKPINQGKLLILSPHAPQLRSNKENQQISRRLAFGLATELYIAETKKNPKDWAAAVEQKLNRQRIFARVPEEGEKNGNEMLVQFGATPVDLNGKEVKVQS